MKKIVALFIVILFSLTVAFSQEQTQNQTQTQTQVQSGEQSGDPIMEQKRIRTNESQGTITRAEKREMKKENHGAVVSETARSTESGQGKGQSVSGVAKQNRINTQAKPRINRPSGFGVPQGARSGAMRGGGKR
jgi:hypothetical protein